MDAILVPRLQGPREVGNRKHLRLTADFESELFVKHLSLADFPFTPFSKSVDADTEPESRYPSAWSWILLLQLIDSFSKDQGSNIHVDDELFYAFEALRETGLLPSPDFKHIVSTSAKSSVSAKLATIGGGFETTQNSSVSDIPFFPIGSRSWLNVSDQRVVIF